MEKNEITDHEINLVIGLLISIIISVLIAMLVVQYAPTIVIVWFVATGIRHYTFKTLNLIIKAIK